MLKKKWKQNRISKPGFLKLAQTCTKWRRQIKPGSAIGLLEVVLEGGGRGNTHSAGAETKHKFSCVQSLRTWTHTVPPVHRSNTSVLAALEQLGWPSWQCDVYWEIAAAQQRMMELAPAQFEAENCELKTN